jgi:formate C-acetyltransferase
MLPKYRSAGEVCSETEALVAARSYHVAALWRAASFRATARQPMTLRRAEALNAVLAQCDCPILPGELLLGSSVGRLAKDGDPEALEDAYAVLRAVDSRNFLTGFDHHAPDYAALLHEGVGGLLRRVDESPVLADPAREPFLRSVRRAVEGFSHFVYRLAAAAEAAEVGEYAELLHTQAAMLTRLASAPPRTFWEALQLILLAHQAFQLDERYAMAFGRLDVLLFPFYDADTRAGRLTDDEAQTLLDHFFAKVAHRSDIQNICLGGVDAQGRDAVNPVSFMCLEAVKRIGKPGGNVTVRVHPGTPDRFLRKCAEVIRTGIGFPALYNDAVEIPALVAQGYPLEEVRDYCFVGCIEAFLPGRMGPWADGRFNLLRCVNLALYNGTDTITGRVIGPRTGEPATWDAFFAAFLAQMRSGLVEHVAGLNAVLVDAEAQADNLTSPWMSALAADCIARGLDVCAGGARYPGNHGVAGMGVGSTADALMAIKRYVYDEARFTLPALRRMLDMNFTGYDQERRLLLDAPKYGNDDTEVDAIAADVARAFGQEVLRYRTPRGGRYWGLMAANVQNVSAGREVGATADGRLAYEPLSDAASPSFGRDVHGPTAVARSVAKLDYALAPGGNVVNMKILSSALQGEEGLAALSALVRGCFNLGGAQLQFNTTDRALLREAMAHPEAHRDLVVRVSGFSAYFVTLDRAVQEDILTRSEHTL